MIYSIRSGSSYPSKVQVDCHFSCKQVVPKTGRGTTTAIIGAKMMLFVTVCCLLLISAAAFRPVPRAVSPRASKLNFSPSDLSTLLTALEEAKPDDYVYGAVAAPDFVLPLAAFGSVALAGIFFLLAPGEEALEAQRQAEAEKGDIFNRRKNEDLR